MPGEDAAVLGSGPGLAGVLSVLGGDAVEGGPEGLLESPLEAAPACTNSPFTQEYMDGS